MLQPPILAAHAAIQEELRSLHKLYRTDAHDHVQDMRAELSRLRAHAKKPASIGEFRCFPHIAVQSDRNFSIEWREANAIPGAAGNRYFSVFICSGDPDLRVLRRIAEDWEYPFVSDLAKRFRIDLIPRYRQLIKIRSGCEQLMNQRGMQFDPLLHLNDDSEPCRTNLDADEKVDAIEPLIWTGL